MHIMMSSMKCNEQALVAQDERKHDALRCSRSAPSGKSSNTTMQQMLFQANHILDKALSPATLGVPCDFFSLAKGIVLLSTIEAGFLLSGTVGNGILMARLGPDNSSSSSWSPPCAVGLSGIGCGLMAGASMKDLIVFLFDAESVETIIVDVGMKFGGQAQATVGAACRTAETSINLSNAGVRESATVAFSRGYFGGISLEGAVITHQKCVNAEYYQNERVSPEQIVFGDCSLLAPHVNDRILHSVYRKLALLAGERSKPFVRTERSRSCASGRIDLQPRRRNVATSNAKSSPEKMAVVEYQQSHPCPI